MNYNGRETLTILQATKTVGVSRRTIYNWIGKNKVEWVRTAGGSIRILKDSLYHVPGPQSDTSK
jgi:excisionase family DNA binding protein